MRLPVCDDYRFRAVRVVRFVCPASGMRPARLWPLPGASLWIRDHGQPSGQCGCLRGRHGVGSAAVHGAPALFVALCRRLYHPPPGAAYRVADLGRYQSVGQMVAGADLPPFVRHHGYPPELRDCHLRMPVPHVSAKPGQSADDAADRAGGGNGRWFWVRMQAAYLMLVLLFDVVRQAGRSATETAEKAGSGRSFAGTHRQSVAVR